MNKLLEKTMEELRFVADTVSYIIGVEVCDNSSYELVNGLLNNLLDKRHYTKEELAKVYCMLYRKDEDYEEVLNILNFF